MTKTAVLTLLSSLQAVGTTVWVDGGWCDEALVGRSLRPHADLAVLGAEEPMLR